MIEARWHGLRTLLSWAVFVGICGGTGLAQAEEITEIVVVDNSKTTTSTVLYLANIEVGDDWDDDEQEKVRLDLISSGLFKDVKISSAPHPDGGVRVTISARDKHSWVIAPTYYDQPTNRGGGVGFGENNLFGQNKKLLLYGQVATLESFFVAAYIDPAIGQTPFHWQFDTYLANLRSLEFAAPTEWWREEPQMVRESKMRYFNLGATVGATLFRTVSVDGRLRGAYLYYSTPKLLEGATEEDVGVAPGEAIPKPGGEGWDLSWKGSFSIDTRANYFGVTTGTRLELGWEKSLPAVSDFRYRILSAIYQKGIRVYERQNLVLRSKVSWGQDIPFQHERTAGGTRLRGYKQDQFRGDFNVTANLEYSLHLLSIPFPLLEQISIRGLGFLDSTYTRFNDIEPSDDFRNYLPGHDDITGLRGFRNAVGAGVRFYAKSIVLPLLGLDIGYGLETNGVEVYLAIGLTDV